MTTPAPVVPPPEAPPIVPPVVPPAPVVTPTVPPVVVPPTDEPKTILGGAAAPKPGEPPGDVKPQGAPEYTSFTLPEGMTPDPKLMDGFKSLAKESGLSQEVAQKFVTLQSDYAKAEIEALVKETEIQKVKMVEDLKQQTIKELGSDYQKELGFAGKALDYAEKAAPGLRKLMEETGLGNHPLLVKAYIAFGKGMAEDGMPGPNGLGPENSEQKQMANLFPSMHDKDGNLLPEFAKK